MRKNIIIKISLLFIVLSLCWNATAIAETELYEKSTGVELFLTGLSNIDESKLYFGTFFIHDALAVQTQITVETLQPNLTLKQRENTWHQGLVFDMSPAFLNSAQKSLYAYTELRVEEPLLLYLTTIPGIQLVPTPLIYGPGYSTDPVPLEPGSIITTTITITGTSMQFAIYIDGARYVHHTAAVPVGPRPEYSYGYIRVMGAIYEARFHDPVFTNLDDFRFLVGTGTHLPPDPTAHWGLTTHNTIPTMGTITKDVDSGDAGVVLSTDGTYYDRIGVKRYNFVARDDHSLSEVGWYVFDNTFAQYHRKLTIWTPLAPLFRATYADAATNTLGNPIVGLAYDSTSPTLPCNGEDGWTNQPINISIDPGTILGSFDTVLNIFSTPETIETNGIATRTDYNIQSPATTGTAISGILTEIGELTNELSGIVTGTIKIDTTAPTPSAIHTSGATFIDTSTDDLSEISVLNPSKIALTPVGDPEPPADQFTLFDDITQKPNGHYDIWVQATDKAGNVATERVLSNLYIQFGEVLITKDTDQGATLHEATCPNVSDITITSCTLGCTIGANTEIEEKSPLTYKLTLTNTDILDTATGIFTDYLPLGSVVTTMPIANPASSVSGLTFALETTGPYTGHYKITGNYTLAPGAQVEIDILSKAPPFDKVTPANNLIRNQATLDWTIDTHNGNNDSNFALHELTERPSVDTIFTKVGADDLNTGLAGAEFALYRWNGANAPTQAEENQVVEHTVLTDSDWTRVTYDGEDATSMSELFISATSPQGAVDLGALPTGIYTLIETKAPAGYALPVGQWILTIDLSKGDTGTNDWKIEFVGKSGSIMPLAAIRDTGGAEPTYRIINARPFSIGMSGLKGTTRLLLTGFVIMALATNIYLVQAYKRSHK